MVKRMVPVDGCQLNVLEEGRGLPLVIIHGVVTNSQLHAEHIGSFSDKYRTIAVDLRGYGESEKPGRGYTVDQFAADMIRMADHLGLERAVWLGVSMGGMIVQRLCLDNQSRVAGLVLVSTTDKAMILDGDLESIGTTRDYRAVSAKIIDESFRRGANPSWPQRLKERIPTWNAQVLRDALQSMSRFDLRGQLSRITVPTLILAGSEDDSTTPTIARGIQRQIPGSRLMVFDGSSHFVMLEQPEEYRAAVRDFLDGLPTK